MPRTLPAGLTRLSATLTNRTTATTEQVMAQFQLAANDLTVGKIYEIRLAYAPATQTGNESVNVRIGTAGTTADASVINYASGLANNIPTFVETVSIRCTATGTSGTVNTAGTWAGHVTLPSVVSYQVLGYATGVTVNTTAALYVSLTTTCAQGYAATPLLASMHRVA